MWAAEDRGRGCGAGCSPAAQALCPSLPTQHSTGDTGDLPWAVMGLVTALEISKCHKLWVISCPKQGSNVYQQVAAWRD